MDRLSIKRMVGSEERVVAYAVNFEYSAKRMGECFVSVDVKSPTPIDFELGDYIEFRGERFVLTYSPSVVKQARKNTYGEAFSYSGIKFSGISDELTRVRMLDVVEGNNDVHYSQLPKFSFFCGTIDDFISRVQANLDRVYPNEWEVKAEEGAEIATNVEVSIDNKSVWEAMEIIATKFKSSFIVKQEKGKKKIIIGNVLSTGGKYGYGKGNGFLSIERSSESEQQIITRLRAYGSTKNLPAHYYTEPYDIEVRVDRIGERHGLPYLVSKEYKAGGLVTTDECVFLLPFNRPYSHTEQDILIGDVVRESNGHRTPIRFNMSERKGVFGDVYTWLYVEGADIVRDFVFPKPEKVYTKAELDNMLQNGWEKSRNKKFLLFFKDKETGKKADERDITAMWDFLDEDGYPQSFNDDDLRFHNNEVIGYFPTNVEVQQIEAVVYKDSPMTREYEYAEPAKYPSRCVAIPEDRAAYELLRKDGYHLILRGEIWKKPTQFQKIRWYSTTPTAPNNMAVNNLMLPAFLNYKARNEQGEERVLNPYLCEKVDENRVRYPKGSGEIYTIEEVIQDAYVEDAELIKKWGVREGCIYFDQEGEGAEFPEIYPTIQGVTRGEMKAAGYDVGNGDDSERIDELLGGSFQYYNDNGKVVNTEHETIKSQIKDDGNVTFGTQGIKKEEVNDTFYVLVKNMGFDLQAVVNGENTSIKMTDGMCGGREFQLLNQTGSNPKRYVDSNGNVYWRVALKRVWDENTKLWYPNSDYPIKDNDRFVMLGFDLPTPFIQAAEQRLEKAAKEYFASNSRSKYSYVPKIDPVFMAKDLVKNGQNSLHHQLQVGMIIKFSDEDLNVDNANWSEKEKTNTRVTLFVDSLNIKYNDGKQPEYSISLKEEAEFSTLQKIHNQITALQTGVENISSPAKIKRYALASVNGHYLKKQEPDTANGHKTFNDGITSIGKTKMAGEAEVEGNLDVLGKTRAESFEVGPWRGGLLTGSGAKVDERGNAEVESIKVRSRMEVAELVVNRQTTMDADFLLTEGDLVENVKEEANGQFTLTLRREWEGYATSLTEGTVLRGIFNNITQGGATFETTWLKVLSVDTANNAIRVSLYPANECPAGVNHPPRKLLKISRWGHTTDATRQATYLLSSREQRVCLLTNVTKPIIDASNISSWQGKLDGLTWRDAGGQTHQLTGYGNVMGSAYVSGSLHVGGELTGAIADKVNELGEENLLLEGNRPATNAEYLTASFNLTSSGRQLKYDEEVTIVVKGRLGEGRTSFDVYNSNWGYCMCELKRGSDVEEIFVKTFKWLIGDSSNTYIDIFAWPRSSTSQSTIEWVKLVRGSYASREFVPAPEDVAAVPILKSRAERIIAEVEAEKSRLAAEYAKVHQLAQWSGEEGSRVINLNINYKAKADELLKAAQSFIADGLILTSVFDKKIPKSLQDEYRQRAVQLIAALREMQGKIEVGGVNLFGFHKGINLKCESWESDKLGLDLEWAPDIKGVRARVTKAGDGFIRLENYGLREHVMCTFSFRLNYPRAETKKIVDARIYSAREAKDRDVIPQAGWQYVTITALGGQLMTYNNSGIADIHFKKGNSLQVGDIIEIADIKIERGTVATAWTPAPEDVEWERQQTLTKINGLKASLDKAKSDLTTITDDAWRDGIITAAEGKSLTKAKLELLKSEKSYLLARADAVLAAHPQLATTHPTEYNQIREGSASNQNARWYYLLYAEGMINACEAFLAGNSSYIFNGGSNPTATRYEDLFSLWLSSKSLSEWYEFSRNSFEAAIIMADRGKDGADGRDAKPPRITAHETWEVWDWSRNSYVDTNDPARGESGENGLAPRINSSGYWEVYENGVWRPTSTKAKGQDGKKGDRGLSILSIKSLYLLTDSDKEAPELPISPTNRRGWKEEKPPYSGSGQWHKTKIPTFGSYSDDARKPRVNNDGYWEVWNASENRYQSTFHLFRGENEFNRLAPRKDDNGYWEVWDSASFLWRCEEQTYGYSGVNPVVDIVKYTSAQLDSEWAALKQSRISGQNLFGFGRGITPMYTQLAPEVNGTQKLFTVKTKYVERPKPKKGSGNNLYGFRIEVEQIHRSQKDDRVDGEGPFYYRSLYHDYRQHCTLVRLAKLGLTEVGDYAVSFKVRANRKIEATWWRNEGYSIEGEPTSEKRPTFYVNLCDNPETWFTPTEEWQEVKFVTHTLIHVGGNPKNDPNHPTDPYNLEGFLDIEIHSGVMAPFYGERRIDVGGYLLDGDWLEFKDVMIERGNTHTEFKPSLDYLTQLLSQPAGIGDGIVFGGRIDAQQNGQTKAFLNGVNLEGVPFLAAGNIDYDPDTHLPESADVEIWANGHFKFGDNLYWNGENLNVGGIITAEEMRYKVMPFPSRTNSSNPAQINTGTLFINGGGFVEMPYLERGTSREVRFILSDMQVLRPVVKDSRVKLRLDGRIKSQQPSVSFRFVRALGVNYGDDGNTYWYIHYDGEITKENIAYS